MIASLVRRRAVLAAIGVGAIVVVVILLVSGAKTGVGGAPRASLAPDVACQWQLKSVHGNDGGSARGCSQLEPRLVRLHAQV
jgi:hypothetical protein